VWCSEAPVLTFSGRGRGVNNTTGWVPPQTAHRAVPSPADRPAAAARTCPRRIELRAVAGWDLRMQAGWAGTGWFTGARPHGQFMVKWQA
jgi:hypothetical protein